MPDFPEDTEFISQPLMTPGGFVNPACLNELEATIASIPPTFKRLAGDSEWNTPRITSRKEIIGAFARWACEQSPYNVPDGLENVCKYLNACLVTAVQWDTHGFAKLSLVDVNRLLHEILMNAGVKEFDAWNQSKDGGKTKVVFVSGFDAPRSPDSDYIDLHALLHNVCLHIRSSRREFDAFNADFDRRHAKQET